MPLKFYFFQKTLSGFKANTDNYKKKTKALKTNQDVYKSDQFILVKRKSSKNYSNKHD